MSIEEFDVSEACRDQLRSTGISSVDELVEFFLYIKNATFTISWGDCFEEVLNQLKIMELLPKDYLD